MLLEGISRDGQVGVDGAPVAEECLVADRVEFLEENGYFDAGLEVGLGVVAELRVGKFVVDFSEGHPLL
jgi:hypothetical protein